jgi:hypothetical protein
MIFFCLAKSIELLLCLIILFHRNSEAMH